MARGCKSPLSIFPSPVERVQLEQWQRSTTLQLGLAKRGQIVLLRADALALTEIARCLGVGRRIVRKWLKRFQGCPISLAAVASRFFPRGGGTSG
jgi:hypothetical protein